MGDKRKRTPGSIKSASPTKKKIIVDPEYRKLSECTLRRVRRVVPSDVMITKIEIESAPLRELTDKLQRIARNGRSVNKLGILVGVMNYTNMYPNNHAIAVYKWGDVLYCFDPWGSRRNRISDKIFKILKEVLGCSKIRVYNGSNLQAYDTYGVCVGLSSNFIVYMANRSTHLRQFYSLRIKRALINQSINNIASNLKAKTLALSKPRSTVKSLTPMNVNSPRSLTPMNVNK